MDPGETGSYTLQVAMTGICVLLLVLSFNYGHWVNSRLARVLSASSIRPETSL